MRNACEFFVEVPWGVSSFAVRPIGAEKDVVGAQEFDEIGYVRLVTPVEERRDVHVPFEQFARSGGSRPIATSRMTAAHSMTKIWLTAV